MPKLTPSTATTSRVRGRTRLASAPKRPSRRNEVRKTRVRFSATIMSPGDWRSSAGGLLDIALLLPTLARTGEAARSYLTVLVPHATTDQSPARLDRRHACTLVIVLLAWLPV